jgi:hypothetical protein
MSGRHPRRRAVVIGALSLAITAPAVGFWSSGAASKNSKTIGFTATGISMPETQSTGQEPQNFSCTPGQPEIMRSSTGGTPTVDIAVTGGSAIAGTDYTLASTTVTFQNGRACVGIPLSLIDDEGSGESGETVQLTLSNPSNGYALGIGTTTITIIEDASPTTPLKPAATVTAGSQVNLSWGTGGTDSWGRAVDEYIVLRSTTSGSGYTQVGTTPGTINSPVSFTDNTVPGRGTYYYVVQAVDDGITTQSPESDPVTTS